MAKVSEIRDFLNEKYPFYMKLGFDNVGMLVGFCGKEVTKILVALDITDDVIDEAINCGAQLIVSHHPLIFNALKTVTDDDFVGRKIIKMISGGISGICLHTNLDTAEGGVNDALMQALGATVNDLAAPHGTHPDGSPYGITRIGTLDAPTDMNTFLLKVKKALNANGLRYHDSGKPVYKIGACGGSGGDDMSKAFSLGCDTYVTADVKYDTFLWAKQNGLNLIDADHFCTENVVVPVLHSCLSEQYPEIDVCISQVHKQTAQFI